MTDYRKAWNQRNKLCNKIQSLKTYIHNLEVDYEVITDQYMNGDISWNVGRYQRRITREIEKSQRKLSVKLKKLSKLEKRYRAHFIGG